MPKTVQKKADDNSWSIKKNVRTEESYRSCALPEMLVCIRFVTNKGGVRGVGWLIPSFITVQVSGNYPWYNLQYRTF